MAADVIITHAVTNGPSVAMDTSLVIMDTVPVCWNMEDKNKNENTFYHNFCYKNNSLLNGRKRQSDQSYCLLLFNVGFEALRGEV